MSIGSPGPKSPNTPISLSRWKEALAGTWFLPPRQWDSWKGIITPGCQDGAGAHRLPRMWLMANLSSKKIGFQGNWKLFSQSQVLQGAFPPVYSPLLPLGQPRTCGDLKKNWECLTVSLINKKRDRKPGSGLVHERREHTRCASPRAPWLDGYSECPTRWPLEAWAGPEHPYPALSILSQEKRYVSCSLLTIMQKAGAITVIPNWNLTFVQNFPVYYHNNTVKQLHRCH